MIADDKYYPRTDIGHHHVSCLQTSFFACTADFCGCEPGILMKENIKDAEEMRILVKEDTQ